MPPPDSGERIGQAKIQVSIALGDVIAATATLPTSFQALSTVCQLDPAHDALLPLQVSLSNDGPVALDTTLNFAVTDLRNRLLGNPDPLAIEAATTFDTTAPSCTAIGDSEQVAGLEYPNLTPGQTVVHNYLLVLSNFYSPNYDSNGDLYDLRHMVGWIKSLQVFVTGDSANNALPLDAVSCYTGPPHQAVDGPGAAIDALYVPEAIGPPPAGDSPILPDFVLAESGFDYSFQPGGSSIYPPTRFTAC
jgi:hypothetical protein